MSELPSDYAQAVALFKAFQLRDPRRGEIVQLAGWALLSRPLKWGRFLE